MGEASTLIARARALLTPVRPSEPVEKTFWGSPAGKKRIADRLAKLLPGHRTYVEPFAGSAAVLFAKEPSEVEVINDADPDIAEAYRLIQKLREQDFARLEKMSWVGDEATYRRLYDAKPGSDVEKLHRFLYLTHFSYGKMRGRSFSANVQGIEARTMDRPRAPPADAPGIRCPPAHRLLNATAAGVTPPRAVDRDRNPPPLLLRRTMSEPENVDPDATPEATAASRREAYTPSANVRVLRDGARTLYLVGTAHVSQASVDEVREVIEALRPDTVCVELCQARYDALTDEDRWKNLDIFKVIREGKFLFLLANLAIGAWQRRIGRELGVTPGAELLAAAEKAREVDADVVLIDRDIHTTLRRTWGNLRLRDKAMLLMAIGNSLTGGQDDLDGESIEALKEQGNL